jgi:hypothetical protein
LSPSNGKTPPIRLPAGCFSTPKPHLIEDDNKLVETSGRHSSTKRIKWPIHQNRSDCAVRTGRGRKMVPDERHLMICWHGSTLIGGRQTKMAAPADYSKRVTCTVNEGHKRGRNETEKCLLRRISHELCKWRSIAGSVMGTVSEIGLLRPAGG